MKVSVKQYARSLFEITADKSETELAHLITRFINFLHRRQDLNKMTAIIAELENIYEQQSGIMRAELLSARPLQNEIKQEISAYLERKAGVAQVKLTEKIDTNLIGGFVLRYNGLVVDGSLKNNLLKFKKQLSN